MTSQTQHEFLRLLDIMKRLRRDCPWDSEQTPESLRQYVIEEAYEVVEAIERGNVADLQEELGDLILQVVFQSEIAGETGLFGIEDVLRGINEKLVRRHPHVFGEVAVSGADEVVQNWEQIKRREKTDTARLDGVPRALPALLRAARIISKCRRAGLDLAPDATAGRKAAADVQALVEAGAPDEARIGAALFALAGWVQDRGINPEDALRTFTDRLVERLHRFETRLADAGRSLEDLSPEERRRLADDLACDGNHSGL